MRDVRRRQPGIADVDGIGGDEFDLAIDAAVEVVVGRMWRHVVVELVGYADGQEVRRVVTQMLFHIESKRCVSTDMLSEVRADRKSTRLNSSHVAISYAVFCLK